MRACTMNKHSRGAVLSISESKPIPMVRTMHLHTFSHQNFSTMHGSADLRRTLCTLHPATDMPHT